MTATQAVVPGPGSEQVRHTVRIDLRCAERLDDAAAGRPIRCQLMCGHETQHAVMFSQGGARVARTWAHRGDAPEDGAVEIPALPWVRGLAVPMWIEP